MPWTSSFRIRYTICIVVVCAAMDFGIHAARANDTSVSIRVEPQQAKLAGNLSRLQLLVTGTNSSGRQLDLTRSAKYENLSTSVVSVSETGVVVPLASGTGRIRVQHGKQAIEIPVTVTGVLPQAEVSFRLDVIPVLSRAGCNQGACHGSQFGKGGMKLSLLGFAPEQDYAPLVRDRMGRRVSLIEPQDSLILHKALLKVGHSGGKRFHRDSFDHEVLRSWLATGAPAPKWEDPEVVDLTVSPSEQVYRVGQSQQLRVVARYSDKTTRDVTLTAKYNSLREGVATVMVDGFITAVGKGQAAVMVRYEGQAKVSHVLSPFAEYVELADFKPDNFIDEKVKARWKRLGIKPSGLCTDAEFIRRTFLDSIGTLPAAEMVNTFLESKNPKKRNELVDELLGLTGDPKRDVYVDAWSAYWALKWGDLLRNNRKKVGTGGMWALFNWMRQSLRENKPVDRFVREIITAQGSTLQHGPTNYYITASKPTDLAETTAQVFLGVRIQCARCHHHPFEVYSQADYYGLAAFFTRVGTKRSGAFGVLGGDSVVKLNSSGSIQHPRTGKTIPPTPLAGKPIDVAGVRDLRRPLARWLTSPGNKMFSQNIVNRIWSYFMGSGLVEPIDDMRGTNPASNPELLEALSDHFVESQFDLRKLMRAIMTSRIYQLSSTTRPENVTNTRFYPHYNVKRLPAEVLLDAIDSACGTRERFSGVPLGTRAIELPDPNVDSYFLDTLGRPQRAIACECERTAQPNLAQVLHIANGELINRKLADKNGRISKLVADKKKTDEDAITRLYLVTFSRRPGADEVRNCQQILSRAANRREGLEDILWALLNSREFLFNH